MVGMTQTESKQFPLGKFPYKIAISREELEVAVTNRKVTGEPIQSFVRRLIREHASGKGSERFSIRQLLLHIDIDQPGQGDCGNRPQ
jgi:hypothetical protein